jgi:hypothetical protein
MLNRHDYLTLAKDIKRDLDSSHLAFKSYARTEFTERLRKISGEPNTRIKTGGVAPEIETVFAEQGLRVFPLLSETTTGDWVRVWRAGTLAAEMLDLVVNPGTRSDEELGEMATKIKGKWVWEEYPSREAASAGAPRVPIRR